MELAFEVQANLQQFSSVNVVVDDSLFGPQQVPGGWEWADMTFDYGL